MNSTAWLGSAFSALLDLTIPTTCAGCGSPGMACCAQCQEFLRPGEAQCWQPSPPPPGFPRTFVAAEYAGVVREVIVAWKDGDRPHLGRELAPLLASSWAGAIRALPRQPSSAHPLLVVPAPSRASAVRQRGYRPIADVSRSVGRELGGPVVVVNALTVSSTVADQAGLSHRQRANNLAGAMTVSARARSVVAGADILLIDDVVTTGATLAQMATTLQAGGARSIVAATMAATHRRHPPRRVDFALSPTDEAV